jgi:hypothetical protein
MQAARNTPRAPHNRIGLDYARVPVWKVRLPIVDAHVHVNDVATAERFFQAAQAYGVERVVSMSPLASVPALRERFPGRIGFIAVPRWRDMKMSDDFRRGWCDDLERFRSLEARWCKFWMAPPMRQRHGLTLEHEFLRPVIDHALRLGYEFMVHVGDPTVWWAPGRPYADVAGFGAKPEQYASLEWFLNYVHPRHVIGAHFGGSVEDLEFLQGLLDRHGNYVLDSSATKWIVREVARQPNAVRAFVIRNRERILFGSDLVTSEKTDLFDHYASRYWAQRTMWETAYRGESPIEDPDGEQPPRLAGLDLPEDVLEDLYLRNAERLLG